MDAFTFILKTALFTAALIWAMQFKYENKTVENHFVEFVQGSSATQPIHKVAQGARQMGSDGWTKFREFIGSTGTDAKKKQIEPDTTRKASTFKWQGGE